jgi:hypothetical protein
MLGKIKRMLKNREAQNRGLAEWVFGNVCEVVRRGEQDKDLAIVKSRPLEDVEAFVEAGFLRDTLIRDNPALAEIFGRGWNKHVKAYNVTASFPRPGGENQTLLFIAAYDSPWGALTLEDVREGIIEGAPMDFYEEADKMSALVAKGKL